MEKKELYLVSACLVGSPCRYDGRDSLCGPAAKLAAQGRAVPVCPEQLGGLTTPRSSCELTDQQGEIRIRNKDGEDFTEEFLLGARRTLDIAKVLGVRTAIMKSKSPSCGCGRIYDGTFSGKLVPGYGVAARLLMEEGIEIVTEEELAE